MTAHELFKRHCQTVLTVLGYVRTQMSEAELRELAQVLREQAGSGTARKAAVAKQAKVMSGKAVKLTTLDDLFG